MRNAILISICLLLGTAVAAPPPVDRLSTCELGAGVPCVTVILTDVVVEDGETEQYNNGTYSFQGNLTVESGGTVEMIKSSIAFAEGEPVHVQAGGRIVIDAAELTGSAPEGARTPIIQLDAGALVTIVNSGFTTLTISVGADNATIRNNQFELGFPALLFQDWDGELADNVFQNNIEAINATGGSPDFHDLQFYGDALGLRLDQVQCALELLDMYDVRNGIELTGGACTMISLALDDRSLPPDTGVHVTNGVGQTTISLSHIQEFGTGIYYCNASVAMSDNTFANNGQDVATC